MSEVDTGERLGGLGLAGSEEGITGMPQRGNLGTELRRLQHRQDTVELTPEDWELLPGSFLQA